jgi:hypothetical protein
MPNVVKQVELRGPDHPVEHQIPRVTVAVRYPDVEQ